MMRQFVMRWELFWTEMRIVLHEAVCGAAKHLEPALNQCRWCHLHTYHWNICHKTLFNVTSSTDLYLVRKRWCVTLSNVTPIGQGVILRYFRRNWIACNVKQGKTAMANAHVKKIEWKVISAVMLKISKIRGYKIFLSRGCVRQKHFSSLLRMLCQTCAPSWTTEHIKVD